MQNSPTYASSVIPVTRDVIAYPKPARPQIRNTSIDVELRKRDPGAAKPYNCAHSPILAKPVPGCTLVAPSSKHPEEWLTRDYTEIYTGRTVKLSEEYDGHNLTPQVLSNVLWRHYLHPEDKSLAPDGTLCCEYTRGLLQRRPMEASPPFVLIGKEIERRGQEGEEISVLENAGPIQYSQRQTLTTRRCAPELVKRINRFSLGQLGRSGLTRDTIIRARRAERVHPSTSIQLADVVQTLERGASDR